MTPEETLNEFNFLYTNSGSNQMPDLNGYEVSLLLTKAQDELLKNLSTSTPGGNKYQQGVEDSSRRNMLFIPLLTDIEISSTSSTAGFDVRSKSFKLPTDIFKILGETFKTAESETSTQKTYQVYPIQYEEYTRMMSKPYKSPLKNQVWQILGDSLLNDTVEIIPQWEDTDNTVNKLHLRYIRVPYPIIIEDLEIYDRSIHGETAVYDNNKVCELNDDFLHMVIQRAVELAKVTYTGGINEVMQTGTRSE